MKKWIKYTVIGLLVVFWVVFAYGYFYCINFLPINFEIDDLQGACFGVGFFFWPFVFGFFTLIDIACKYLVPLFKSWFSSLPSSGSR